MADPNAAAPGAQGDVVNVQACHLGKAQAREEGEGDDSAVPGDASAQHGTEQLSLFLHIQGLRRLGREALALDVGRAEAEVAVEAVQTPATDQGGA
jgi:hypothetical protein